MVGCIVEALPKVAARPKSWGGELPEDPIVATQGFPGYTTENDANVANLATSSLSVPSSSARRAPRGVKRAVGAGKKTEAGLLAQQKRMHLPPLAQPTAPAVGDIRAWFCKQPSEGNSERIPAVPSVAAAPTIDRLGLSQAVSIEDEGEHATTSSREEGLGGVLQLQWDMLDGEEFEASKRRRRVCMHRRRWEDEDDVDDPVNDDSGGSSTTASSPQRGQALCTTSMPVSPEQPTVVVGARGASGADSSPLRREAQPGIDNLVNDGSVGSAITVSSLEGRTAHCTAPILAASPRSTVVVAMSGTSRAASSPPRQAASAYIDDPANDDSMGSSTTASSPPRRTPLCTKSMLAASTQSTIVGVQDGASFSAKFARQWAARCDVGDPGSPPQRRAALFTTSPRADPTRSIVEASVSACAAGSPSRQAAQPAVAEVVAANAKPHLSIQPSSVITPLDALSFCRCGTRVDIKAEVLFVGEVVRQELALQQGEFVATRSIVLSQGQCLCQWMLWANEAERHGPGLVGQRILLRGAKIQGVFDGLCRISGGDSLEVAPYSDHVLEPRTPPRSGAENS
eukprot:TRINITY_DN7056_c0_g1_i1.p1 TRINITY_DN7056_c0_g1~~TRINITY_DN7056_c0_g1_i1.p1  ORF type:complete len:570 (+),score=87.53 TRINITY_DN7056_c0_g1_i1:168-1877(+)